MFDTKKKYDELKINYDRLFNDYKESIDLLARTTNAWKSQIYLLRKKQRHYNWRFGRRMK